MLHDERYFPCADVFNPDRYISKEQASRNKNVHQLNTFKPDDPSNLTFGFGRRSVAALTLLLYEIVLKSDS